MQLACSFVLIKNISQNSLPSRLFSYVIFILSFCCASCIPYNPMFLTSLFSKIWRLFSLEVCSLSLHIHFLFEFNFTLTDVLLVSSASQVLQYIPTPLIKLISSLHSRDVRWSGTDSYKVPSSYLIKTWIIGYVSFQ